MTSPTWVIVEIRDENDPEVGRCFGPDDGGTDSFSPDSEDGESDESVYLSSPDGSYECVLSDGDDADNEDADYDEEDDEEIDIRSDVCEFGDVDDQRVADLDTSNADVSDQPDIESDFDDFHGIEASKTETAKTIVDKPTQDSSNADVSGQPGIESDFDDFYGIEASKTETVKANLDTPKATKCVDVEVGVEQAGVSTTNGVAADGNKVPVGQTVSKHNDLIYKKSIHMLNIAQRIKQQQRGGVDGMYEPVDAGVLTCNSDSALHGICKQPLMAVVDKAQSNELEVKRRAGHAVSNSRKDMFQAKADVLGDTLEAHFRVGETVIIDGEEPFVSGVLSPEFSTGLDAMPAVNVDATPTARGTNEESIARSSETSGTLCGSVASGRNNPRAKMDSEIRSVGHHQEFTRIFLTDHAQPQRTSSEHVKTEGKLEKQSQCIHTNSTPKPPAQELPAKPEPQPRKKSSGVARQLRSIAHYQGGKLRVSIQGGQPVVDPADVQITFVQTNPQVNTHGNNKSPYVVRWPQAYPNQVSALKGVLPAIHQRSGANKRPPTRDTDVTKTLLDQTKAHQLRCYDFHSIPTIQKAAFGRNHVLPALRTKIVNGRAMAIKTDKSKENDLGKSQKKCAKKKKASPLSYQPRPNMDIVNCRAQYPPFNTHVNPEASSRHQKLLNFVSII